ncbi:DUF6768 family protein [Pseudoalteromonas sp. S1688]|jgi:heme/copper-type cytochrome/quinol oxidase subunit 4|uniref:DUF6768 family protein n=1 Tax=Pseudoalteromonas sp. S1688 TaxID=579511 RepID=UPI000C496710|nr:DUF6768 family protein [Pseudoalteromonas sp. S1688]MAE35793.1 hypothetical protein [Oceanospirillaceae bacterium]TMP50230.1 hypothetical protein CWB81_11405 [Pseudoalteromonas sp. S1688]|tara:strand:- start:3801 stop:4193 length:393 start_codon:yes stop_codon:yes gene_type:complete
MNLDEKIKQELESEAKKLDKILAHEPGIFNMLANAYKGALGGWLILVGIFTFLITLLLFWAGYQFFLVTELNYEQKIFWGLVMIFVGMVQIALKMWTFMEMNRQSTNREIKRLEMSIERLVNTLIKTKEA